MSILFSITVLILMLAGTPFLLILPIALLEMAPSKTRIITANSIIFLLLIAIAVFTTLIAIRNLNESRKASSIALAQKYEKAIQEDIDANIFK